MVKNLDTVAASNPSLLAVICSLVQVKWIHLIASSDRINSPLGEKSLLNFSLLYHTKCCQKDVTDFTNSIYLIGISQNQAVLLNLSWVPCSTFQSYEEELSWNPSAFGEKSQGEGGQSTLQYVLKSLTGNARKAFSILASLQLAKTQGRTKSRGGSKDPAGIEFRELARKCRESFLAHTDAALNTLLREFIDHKLITFQGKKLTTNNVLTIDLDTQTLHEIVNEPL
jgi:hypothetical protein